MLRFLIKFLLLTIILGAATKLIAEWKLEKDIDSLRRAVSPIADFEYESAKIGLNGEVKVNGISIFVHGLDAKMEIGEVRFFAGNLYQLALLKSNIQENKLPENGHIIFQNVLIPFNSALIEKAKAAKGKELTSWGILGSAFCGEQDSIGFAQLDGMGYDYLAFSGKEFYMLDKYSGSIVVNGELDIEDFFKLDYQLNIGSVLAWLDSTQERAVGVAQKDYVKPDLSLLEIRIKDKGYNLRKSQYCAQKQGVSVEEYYTGHVTKVTETLSAVGIDFLEPAQEAYAEVIKPESEFYWFMQPQASFEPEGVEFYTLAEFAELSRLRIKVNGTEVEAIAENWTAPKFAQIAQKETEKREMKDPTKARYRTHLITKTYQDVLVNQADQFLNYQVKAWRDDGRVFQGKLTKTSNTSLWITVRKNRGEIVIPLARNKVVKFQVYREKKTS